jgi:hypothetical protein
VLIVAGNSVSQGQIGEEGQLSCYFDDTKKWGIDMDEGDQIMIHQANLLRVPPNAGDARFYRD